MILVRIERLVQIDQQENCRFWVLELYLNS